MNPDRTNVVIVGSLGVVIAATLGIAAAQDRSEARPGADEPPTPYEACLLAANDPGPSGFATEVCEPLSPFWADPAVLLYPSDMDPGGPTPGRVVAMGDVQTLISAAKSVGHDHRYLNHPQTGNPFYGLFGGGDWWSDGRFQCPLCLAIMTADGADIAMEFIYALPFQITYHFNVRWWKRSYLATLPYIVDQFDREYLRERLAEALRRGKEQQRLVAGGASDG